MALARANMEILRFDRALDAAERALTLAPHDPVVQVTHGEVLQRLGRFEEAGHAYKSAGAHNPAILQRLALVESPDPGDESALLWAELYVRDGTPGRALALLSQTAENGSLNPDVLGNLADLFLFYGMPEWTESVYEAAGDQAGVERRQQLSHAAEF